MARYWELFLAWMRVDLELVCKLSRRHGLNDFHDWPDGHLNQPLHFVRHRCIRCGKEFVI
jgi:hypothetical protein